MDHGVELPAFQHGVEGSILSNILDHGEVKLAGFMRTFEEVLDVFGFVE